jgi:GT2 family glycosyltransferase
VPVRPDIIDPFSFVRILELDMFDPSWYARNYSSKYNIQINLLEHYIRFGVELQLNPSKKFDTAYYLEANPDVKAAGIHPLLHFVTQGIKEGRRPLRQYQPEVTHESYVVEQPRYVARLAENTPRAKKAARVIAFYLPQFHPVTENDLWWGKGFTEWTNVKPATPMFKGHYQPHIPDDYLGYYDLRDTAVMRKQVELAKQYGVEGFCFYTYWFAGRRLLETPLDNYTYDQTLDLPFCICWANENWSRRWDGLDQDILIAQSYSPEDDIAFIAEMSKYLRDPRYISVGGKPLLIVYRPNLLPSMAETAQRWRAWCRDNDLGEIYIAYVQSFERRDPSDYGLDAAIEFPPNNSAPPELTTKPAELSPEFVGHIYDWRIFLKRSEEYETPPYTIFRGTCPSWDNTPRKKGRGVVFAHSSPKLFERWLTNAIYETRQRTGNVDERLIFINAWNEWGEGAHLEPDRLYGYAWLQAVRNAQETVISEDSRHPEIMSARRNKLAEIFGRQPDASRYNFLMDYESLLQQSKKKRVKFFLNEGIPSFDIGGKAHCIETRRDLKELTGQLYSEGAFCFVVLQYNNSDLTIRCVESIKKLGTADQDVHIIVVDNKSTQAHLDAISDCYVNDPQVHVVRATQNFGFSGGNNIGYRYAREVIKARFCAILNNDVEILQNEFISRVLAVFDEESYSIAGPDILIDDGRQENPWADCIYTIEEFQCLKSLREAERADYLAGHPPSFKKTGSANPRAKRCRGALLQGAALIASPVFIAEHAEMFDDRLFLYGEEFLLAAGCMLRGHLTVYDSTIQVRHREGASTAVLSSHKKMMLGYDSAISSINFVLDRLERKRAAIRGEVINSDQENLIRSITRGASKHVLIDLFFCQPGFHGGGEYGKAVFKNLTERYATEGGFELWAAIDPDLYIDPWVWETCKNFGIHLIKVQSYTDIVTLVNMDVFHSFFAPAIVVYSGYQYMGKVGNRLSFSCKRTRVIGTLHDIRDFELAMQRTRILQARKTIGCVRELTMSESDIQMEANNYKKHAEELRSMYREIISDPCVESLITVSLYCEHSILNNIGPPTRPLRVLMPPMKPRPDPKPFSEDSVCDLSSKKFALLVNAGREEKNAAMAVAAFDFLFQTHALTNDYDEFKVVLTGISALDQLGLSKIENRSRFICLPEVFSAQYEYLLSNAAILIYPSFNEGFGYPPIEAMSYARVSAVSNVTAIPETCGDAAKYFSPYDVKSVQQAIIEALERPISLKHIQTNYERVISKQRADLVTLVGLLVQDR